MNLQFPKHFSASKLSSFLGQSEFIFKKRDRPIENFLLDLNTMRRSSLLGNMILYKFMHYCSYNGVFNDAKIKSNTDLQDHLDRSGMLPLIDSLVDNPTKTRKAYGKLKNFEKDNFFLFPRALLKDDANKMREINSEYLKTINTFYLKNHNIKAIRPIACCVSEVIKNFWAHSVDDNGTIVSAEGKKDSFNLVIADNGIGIISSLRGIYNEKDDQLIKRCIEKKVSSKKKNSYHMGFGLYYVSELIKINNGDLNIWSEGYHLRVSRKKVTVKKCGYWKGTILDIKLNLQSPKGISCLPAYDNYLSKLKINFGDQK